MATETSNARGEWVLVPREPTEAMIDAWRDAPDLWDVAYAAMLAAAPPPADAEPKTLPVPTRVYLTDKAAVIVGDPQRGWDEEGPDAHNCDAMGCATIGPHVLARVPFTDERAMSQQPEAQEQGGGEVAGWVLEDTFVNAKFWTADTPPQGWTPVYYTAPPSAPVGVELAALRVQEWLHREHDILRPVQEIEQAMRTPCSCPFTERALAQQPAAGAVDEAMVERATTAYLQSRGTYEGEVPVDRDDMRAALTAALATQHQEPTT